MASILQLKFSDENTTNPLKRRFFFHIKGECLVLRILDLFNF